MNEYKGIKFLRWAILLLVLCNIGLLITLWLKPRNETSFAYPRGETPRDFVVRELKFTTEQTKQYDALVHDHQQAMQRLRHGAMDYRQQLFNNLATDQKDNNKPDSLARVIANIQLEIEMVTYRHFAQVRALCTEDQKQQFDKIIADVIRKMNGGMHPPGERPGPPPDGHRPPPPDGQDPAPGGPPPPDGQ